MHISHSTILRELYSYDRFQNNQFVGIIDSLDVFINDVMSYREWIYSIPTFDCVKIEGIENISAILSNLKIKPIKNIHAFITNRTSTSFKWHRDNVDVMLHVIRGHKLVYLKNKKIHLRSNQSIIIPKGAIHKVFSKKGTVALSIGF